jgi:hypothetical protein
VLDSLADLKNSHFPPGQDLLAFLTTGLIPDKLQMRRKVTNELMFDEAGAPIWCSAVQTIVQLQRWTRYVRIAIGAYKLQRAAEDPERRAQATEKKMSFPDKRQRLLDSYNKAVNLDGVTLAEAEQILRERKAANREVEKSTMRLLKEMRASASAGVMRNSAAEDSETDEESAGAAMSGPANVVTSFAAAASELVLLKTSPDAAPGAADASPASNGTSRSITPTEVFDAAEYKKKYKVQLAAEAAARVSAAPAAKARGKAKAQAKSAGKTSRASHAPEW